MAQRVDVFDRPIWQQDSTLQGVLSPCAHRGASLLEDSVTILWMQALNGHLTIGNTMLWVKSPNSKIFLRPIQEAMRFGVESEASDMTYLLGFRKVGFIASEDVLRQLPFDGDTGQVSG